VQIFEKNIYVYLIVSLLTLLILSEADASEEKANSDASKIKNDIDSCILLFYKQKEEAYANCIDFANNDQDLAQRMIGDMHYWGWGNKVKKNIKEAIKWYKRAVKNGNIDAKYNIAVIYEQGKDVEIDYAKAAQWFLSAAKDGHIDSQYNIANMYAKGAGYGLNQRKASDWYLAAANQGDINSQYNLGNRYAIGKGVSKDLAESYKWYYLAARQGDEEARRQLSFLEKSADPVEINRGKLLAEKWRPVLKEGK